MAQTKKTKRWVWLIVLIPALGGLAYFSVKAVGTTPAAIAAEKLARVERGKLTRSVVATGKIEAATKVEVKSKASGIIQSLPLEIGMTLQLWVLHHDEPVSHRRDHRRILPGSRHSP